MTANNRGLIHMRAIVFVLVALTVLAGRSYGQALSPAAGQEGAPAAAPAPAPKKRVIPPPKCARIIKADVVAIDQPFFLNRLGGSNPEGMVVALTNNGVPTNCVEHRLAGDGGEGGLARGAAGDAERLCPRHGNATRQQHRR